MMRDRRDKKEGQGLANIFLIFCAEGGEDSKIIGLSVKVLRI